MRALSGRSLSLEFRFGLLLALIALPVLTVTGLGAFYSVKERSRYYEEYSLAVAADLLRANVATYRTPQALAAGGRSFAADMLGRHQIGLVLRDASGASLVDAVEARIPEDIVAQSVSSGDPVEWKSGSSSYRILAAEAHLGNGSPVRLVLALNIGTPSAVQHAYQSVIIIIALTGGMLIVTLGLILMQRGLEPLRRMTAKTRDITASRLGDRLGIEDTPAELRELADGLNDMLQRLQDSFRRLDEFSSDLAHEVRTPIANMLGQTEVALSRARSVEEYRAVLESNVEEFHRLSRMIQDMLFLAQADSSEKALDLEPVELRSQVDKVVEFYEPLLDEKGIRVLRNGSAEVKANRLLAQRAIANLLSNAVRHAPEGSTLDISIAPSEPGWIALKVVNPGRGIAVDDMPWIFQRFFRGRGADGTGGKTGEGWGLGLAIVKAIMEMHGGRVTAESAPDGMTCFTLYFPEAVAATG